VYLYKLYRSVIGTSAVSESPFYLIAANVIVSFGLRFVPMRSCVRVPQRFFGSVYHRGSASFVILVVRLSAPRQSTIRPVTYLATSHVYFCAGSPATNPRGVLERHGILAQRSISRPELRWRSLSKCKYPAVRRACGRACKRLYSSVDRQNGRNSPTWLGDDGFMPASARSAVTRTELASKLIRTPPIRLRSSHIAAYSVSAR